MTTHVKVVKHKDRITHDWYMYHGNVNLLLRYLAATSAPANALVRAHDKPWTFRLEFEEARAWEAENER